MAYSDNVSFDTFKNSYQDIKKTPCDECGEKANLVGNSLLISEGYPRFICNKCYANFLQEIIEKERNQFYD